MKKFLEFLRVKNCRYEIRDGAVIVLDRLAPVKMYFENIVIPENTDFKRGLDLEDYTGEFQLPENLTVSRLLNLGNTNTKRLPSNLTIYNYCSVYLDAHKFENVSYRENCGYHQRTIFAFWANNEFLIAAGCFVGTYSKFVFSTDIKYNHNSALKYKQYARDCISELAEKLGKPDPFKKATA